jgi:NAD(P)-dependent dehydrogenase (short-subunit alcohol dehydrogenase family)
MNITIIGGSGGIGKAFIENMVKQSNVQSIHATFLHNKPDYSHPRVTWSKLDISNEVSVKTWSQQLGEIDWLINAAGILHKPDKGPEKSIRHLDPDFFIENMMINTIPTLLLAKHVQNKFKHNRPAIFATISAKVGSIEDNRLGGWYSYRASKAALNMCLKTLSIEWHRTLPNVAVASLHPGTTDTPLSKPFQKHVAAHQLFSPDQSVNYMLKVLNGLRPADTGKFWAFDGESLPW